MLFFLKFRLSIIYERLGLLQLNLELWNNVTDLKGILICEGNQNFYKNPGRQKRSGTCLCACVQTIKMRIEKVQNKNTCFHYYLNVRIHFLTTWID